MAHRYGKVVNWVWIAGGLREIRVARVAAVENKTLKRKADEIADSEDDEDEVGLDDDWEGLDEFLVDSLLYMAFASLTNSTVFCRLNMVYTSQHHLHQSSFHFLPVVLI